MDASRCWPAGRESCRLQGDPGAFGASGLQGFRAPGHPQSHSNISWGHVGAEVILSTEIGRRERGYAEGKWRHPERRFGFSLFTGKR